MKSAVFLDLDGTLIGNDGAILPGVGEAMRQIRKKHYTYIVTNQTGVARGLIEPREFYIKRDILIKALKLDGGLCCFHHPNATLEEFRKVCGCRKPEPGMLIGAAADCDVYLSRSWMIGDRMSDIVAGARAGCRTIQVRTGAPLNAPHIETAVPFPDIEPDFICDDLLEAAKVIARESK